MRINAQRITVCIVVYRDGNMETVFQIGFERHFFPARNVLGIIDHTFLDVYDGRDADADFEGFRSNDAADVARQGFERLLHRSLRGEGRGGKCLPDGTFLYDSQADICPSDVYSECHWFDFSTKLDCSSGRFGKNCVFKGTICANLFFFKKIVSTLHYPNT